MQNKPAALRVPQTENNRGNYSKNVLGKIPVVKSRNQLVKQDTPATKIVVRLLSPDMTEDEFNEHLKTWIKPEIISFKYFAAGKEPSAGSGKPPFTATAYIGFKNHRDAEQFRKEYNKNLHVSINGNSMAEYAPFQRGMDRPKSDSIAGSIEQDEYYNSFVAHLNDPTISIISLIKVEMEKSKKNKKQKKSEKKEKTKETKEKTAEEKKENKKEKKEQRSEEKEDKKEDKKDDKEDDKAEKKEDKKDAKAERKEEKAKKKTLRKAAQNSDNSEKSDKQDRSEKPEKIRGEAPDKDISRDQQVSEPTNQSIDKKSTDGKVNPEKSKESINSKRSKRKPKNSSLDFEKSLESSKEISTIGESSKSAEENKSTKKPRARRNKKPKTSGSEKHESTESSVAQT